MKYYEMYMDRQNPSPGLHEKLLHLEAGKKPSSRRAWTGMAALAACAALIAGVGTWKLLPRPDAAPAPVSSAGQFAAGCEPLPGEKDTVGPEDLFVVNSPAEGDKLMFPYVPAIAYPDATDRLEADAARIYAPGSFIEALTKEDIQTIFWGPEGKPEAEHPKTEQGDLPWMLFWDGYTLHGSAWYDGQGQLMELTLWGERDQASFTLELRQGALPFSCAVGLDRGDQLSEFNGVEIAGWSKVYDRNGGGQTDYICGSEFMTQDEVGVRFTSQNNGKAEDGVDGEAWFNALFVRQALTGGLSLDHLMTADAVPAWREETFDTLAQARQEETFAPYLPKTDLSGYDEFYGRLSYQEGRQNMLFVRWSRGYDNVEVDIYRDGTGSYHLADPSKPETYDLRRYPIPWSESVPEEYWETVNDPAFRAEDMSLSLVEARGRAHDTGGMTYSFDVLHPDGTLVSYRCDGMTAQQVWALVEETL